MASDNQTGLENSEKDERDFSRVQVISRAARILRAVRDIPNLKLSQLASEVNLPRTTVYRIVATLESEGLLTTASANGQIELGLELISLGSAVKSNLRQELHPFLEGLSNYVDETVDLSVYRNRQVIFLDQVTRPHQLTAVSGISANIPLHCTAAGKAILAALPDYTVDQIIPDQLKVFTPATIKTREDLIKDLERVRKEGIAFEHEEHTPGICAVGVAIRGLLGDFPVISIPVPSIRFIGKEDMFASALLRTCEAIKNRYNLSETSARLDNH